MQTGDVADIWDSQPAPQYIIEQASDDWQLPPQEQPTKPSDASASEELRIVAAESVETRLTPCIGSSAAPLSELAVVSARDQYARVFFALQAPGAALEVRVSDVVWRGEQPMAGIPHRRVVHFGPVAVNRTGTDNFYRQAPLWLAASDRQQVPSRRQSVWMLQWWVDRTHPAGRWTGELSVSYRTSSDRPWRSAVIPVSIEVLHVQLEQLPRDLARYGVWYGPTWQYSSEESYRAHFADMREAGITVLGMMNVVPYGFRYDHGSFKFTPGRVEDVARRFREAIPSSDLYIDLRLITGYSSLFGSIAARHAAEGTTLPDYVALTADQIDGNPYAVPPVENQWTDLAYAGFATEMKRVIDSLPGRGDAYFFPQEEPTHLAQRALIMKYFVPRTASAGLPVILVTNAGPRADDSADIASDISLVSTDWFDEATLARWQVGGRSLEFYNLNGNLRLTAGFFLHNFPMRVRGLTIWAYQFGDPMRDADTGRTGVYAPVHFLTYPGARGPVPTLRWINFSEGITDRRYAYTVERHIERLRDAGVDVTSIVQQLSDVRSRLNAVAPNNVAAYYDVAHKTGARDLDELRQQYLDLLKSAIALAAS